MGQVSEEIVETFGGLLSLAQVRAALAWHYSNKSEIDADLEAENRATELWSDSIGAPRSLEPDQTLYRRGRDERAPDRGASCLRYRSNHTPSTFPISIASTRDGSTEVQSMPE